MKPLQINFIFFLALFTLSSTDAQESEYTSFDLTDTKWVMSSFTHLGSGTASAVYWEIYTTEDTLINDLIYTKLELRNICSLYSGIDETVANEDVVRKKALIGALREEEKRIYFYRFDLDYDWFIFESGIKELDYNVDYLIYDFNVVVGDTVQYGHGYFDIVIEEDFDNNTRVLETLNSGDESFPNPGCTLVEGKGNLDGLFGSFNSNFTSLYCYASGTSLNGVECTPCKNYVTTTSVEETEVDTKEERLLFPNPVQSTLHIDKAHMDQVDVVYVYSSVGELIKSYNPRTNLKNEVIHKSEIDLNVGLIYVQIVLKSGEIRTEKILIH
ncbi:MAG: hypothetical protein P1U56_14750 [Saprospiraceae bacterium]|nr:hypothetical protein [Saprospiraceae bacterium]